MMRQKMGFCKKKENIQINDLIKTYHLEYKLQGKKENCLRNVIPKKYQNMKFVVKNIDKIVTPNSIGQSPLLNTTNESIEKSQFIPQCFGNQRLMVTSSRLRMREKKAGSQEISMTFKKKRNVFCSFLMRNIESANPSNPFKPCQRSKSSIQGWRNLQIVVSKNKK